MLQALRSSLQQGAGSANMLPAVGMLCRFATAPADVAHVSITSKAANPQDYSLIMKKAAELSSDVKKAPDSEIGLCAGVPLDTFNRKARIYSSAKNASQSGLAKTNHNSSAAPAWRIAFDSIAKWENQLIGWTSTADPVENVGRASLFFYSKDEAIDFCKRHGWQYTCEDPNPRRLDRQKRFNAYGDNFSVKRKGVPDLSHLPSNSKETAATAAAK